MSIGQPTKSIEICDSDDELARAILDDSMEASKAEINANLASFRGHKDWLLSPLFSDYNRAQPSDRQIKAWSRIETTAYKYFARQILRHTVTSNADRVARYCAISEASKRAGREIANARWPDIASHPLKAWLEGTSELADATQEFTDQLYMEANLGCKIEKAMASLTELGLAANDAADEVHQRRGRPEGTSILPRNYISTLEEIYQDSTGQVPSIAAGPFCEFVEASLVAVGNSEETSKDYVAERIKSVRKRVHKLSASSRPSTNDRSRE